MRAASFARLWAQRKLSASGEDRRRGGAQRRAPASRGTTFIALPLFGQSHHPYSYVLNNPLRYVDPSGYQAVDESGDYVPYEDQREAYTKVTEGNATVTVLAHPECGNNPCTMDHNAGDHRPQVGSDGNGGGAKSKGATVSERPAAEAKAERARKISRFEVPPNDLTDSEMAVGGVEYILGFSVASSVRSVASWAR